MKCQIAKDVAIGVACAGVILRGAISSIQEGERNHRWWPKD
ncbi:MAG: hypothetical protein V4437_02535 [Patescibacteria group bacterium]